MLALDDIKVRNVVREWARQIEDRDHKETDYSVLAEDIVGELIERIVRLGTGMVTLKQVAKSKHHGNGPHISSEVLAYYHEYLAISIGVEILKECFPNKLGTPTPELIINAAVVVKARKHRTNCFARLVKIPGLKDLLA